MNANNTLQDATTPYTECCIPLGFEKTKQLLPEISSTLLIAFTKTLFEKVYPRKNSFVTVCALGSSPVSDQQGSC